MSRESTSTLTARFSPAANTSVVLLALFRSSQFGTAEKPNPNRDLFTEANFQNFKCTWEEKSNTAFFRGTATGGGVTIDDNQVSRLS